MNDYPLVVALVDLLCVGLAVYVGMKVHWKGAQPNNRLCISIILFVSLGLWYICGAVLHLNFDLMGTEAPYRRAGFFGVLSVIAFLYGLYLILSGKGAAPDGDK